MVIAVAAPLAVSQAQTIDCGRLQMQLTNLPGNSGDVQALSASIQRQRSELARMTDYGASIGCNRQQFLFFGSAPPPECGPLQDQMRTAQANLSQLNADYQRKTEGLDLYRRDLQDRYRTYCGSEASNRQSSNLIDRLFGGIRPAPESDPLMGDEDVMPENAPAMGGSKAVCVRTCDGGFFPVSYSATQGRMESLAQLCQAQCPNATTEVFTYSMGRDIDDAVSANGSTYRSMPYAGRYRTKFDSTCSCRGEGQSWVDALANAEKLIGTSNRDVIVTPEKSAEMARPKQAKPEPVKLAKPQAEKTPPAKAATNVAAKPDPKTQNAKVQNPKGSTNASANPPPLAPAPALTPAPAPAQSQAALGTGSINASQTFSGKEGEERQVSGPDGVTKRVRVIGQKP